MKTIEMTIYKCEHCNKIYQKKFYCEAHVSRCRKNPDNDRPCFHCTHLEMKTVEYGWYNLNEGKAVETRDALFCNRLKHCVYPPYVTNPYDEGLLEDVNEPMPRECEYKKKE